MTTGSTGSSEAIIHMRVSAAQKAKWVRDSRAVGLRLTDWLVQRVEMYDFDGFSLAVPALRPFEAYVMALGDDEARELFKRVKEFDAKQADAIVAVKVAKSYLEKRVAIADGIADHKMFFDINAWALDYFAMHRELTHLDLMEVLAQ